MSHVSEEPDPEDSSEDIKVYVVEITHGVQNDAQWSKHVDLEYLYDKHFRYMFDYE